MIDIDTWEAGCKVRAIDWVDGKSIYLNMAYYAPGSSLSKPPAKEKSVLLKKCDETEKLLKTMLNSLVNGLMFGGKEARVENCEI